MNVDELSALMRDRDGDAPPLMTTADRVVAIRRDVTLARVRLGAGVAAALAVIAALAAPQFLHRAAEPARPAPEPTSTVLPVSTETRDGLPVYANGGKLGATATGPENGTVSLTFTVPAGVFEIDMTCPAGVGNVQLAMTVNGIDKSGDPRNVELCGPILTVLGGLDTLGMRVGQPSTITVRIVRAFAPGTTGPAVLGDGIPLTSAPFTVGLRAAVPFDEYRFPPPPKVPLAWLPRFPIAVELGARGGSSSPGHPRTYPVTAWECADINATCGLIVNAHAETPGEIVVSVDGQEVATVPIWDYGGYSYTQLTRQFGITNADLAAHGVKVHRGQLVTLSFDSRRMAGRWEIEFYFPSDVVHPG